jgi:hypothetical protein
METYDSLMVELRAVSEEYQSLVDARTAMLDAGDYEGLKAGNEGRTDRKGWFPAEMALTKKSNALKDKLHKLCPDECCPSNNSGRRWHDGGKRQRLDHGFFVCQKCRGMFDYISNEKEVTTIAQDTFSRCEDHWGRERIGVLDLAMDLSN